MAQEVFIYNNEIGGEFATTIRTDKFCGEIAKSIEKADVVWLR